MNEVDADVASELGRVADALERQAGALEGLLLEVREGMLNSALPALVEAVTYSNGA